jgi:hypothetical protein
LESLQSAFASRANMAFSGLPNMQQAQAHSDYSFPLSPPNPPATHVEMLDLPKLMKNPHVQTMYNKYQEATTQIVSALDMQKSLWKENTDLRSEIQSVSAELQLLKANML